MEKYILNKALSFRGFTNQIKHLSNSGRMKYRQTFGARAFAVLLFVAPPPVDCVNPKGDNDGSGRGGGERNRTVHNRQVLLLQAFDLGPIFKRQRVTLVPNLTFVLESVAEDALFSVRNLDFPAEAVFPIFRPVRTLLSRSAVKMFPLGKVHADFLGVSVAIGHQVDFAECPGFEPFTLLAQPADCPMSVRFANRQAV